MNILLLRVKRFFKRYLKVQAETRQKQSARTSSKVNRYLMLLLAASLIAFLYPAENLLDPLDSPQQGEIAQKDIIAPFDITLSKSPADLEDEIKAAVEAVPTILDYNDTLLDSVFTQFERFIKAAGETRDEIQGRFGNDSSGLLAQFTDSVKNEILLRFPLLNGKVVDHTWKIENLNQAYEIITEILSNEIYFTGVLRDKSTLPELKNSSIIIRMGKREVLGTRSKLHDLSEAYLKYLAALNRVSIQDSIPVDNYYELGRHFIAPNLRVNKAEIALRQEQEKASVSPNKETIGLGDVIIRNGQKITFRQAEILTEMYRHQRLTADGKHKIKHYMPVLSRFILVLTAFALLYLYLYYYHRQIFISNPKLLSLFIIYGVELVFIYFIGIKQSLPIYLYPIPIFSILITVLYDAEIGTFNTFILAFLLGILHRFNFSIVLITVIVGIISAYSVRKVTNRTDFFRAVLFTAISYFVLILTLESFNITPDQNWSSLFGYSLLNAVFSPLLAMGFLPIFESIFGFTTNITLLELSDMNNPLLKRMSLEAPGTYHHSLQVGNLAEAASKAIKANPLLARVGAYYHDIGKMEIPEYFVENQLGIKSKHEELTPSMSSIILSSHIKKGRFIGENADLPDEVLNFIEEHHGTMTMSYFLNKAKEMGEDNPLEDEFRYPGPKPQTRETAIVMLADSIEAASRTLNDPKPSRIRNLVENIISDRFRSGELEDCPLTLKDLANIRESFIQILTGVFHHRIEYPDEDDKD